MGGSGDVSMGTHSPPGGGRWEGPHVDKLVMVVWTVVVVHTTPHFTMVGGVADQQLLRLVC